MNTKCMEGTTHGNDITLCYYVPELDGPDAGESPRLTIDCLDLLCHEEAGTLQAGCVGLFEVDALSVFAEGVSNAEEAEAVALWLEKAAAQVRGLWSIDGGLMR